MYSVIVPIYNNEATLPELLARMSELNSALSGKLEAVFVVDGSPDACAALLREALGKAPFASQLIELSRNFGAWAAIKAGLAQASGPYFSVMAADLQEPAELTLHSFQALERGEAEIAIGTRTERGDGRWEAALYWRLYRKFAHKDMPEGGADMFSCTRQVRDALAHSAETPHAIMGLLFSLGFTRVFIPYARAPRLHGKSGWTLRKKLRYALDSLLLFSDAPAMALLALGGICMLGALVAAAGWLIGAMAFDAAVRLFFAGVNAGGLGLIGFYCARIYGLAAGRPAYAIGRAERFNAREIPRGA